MKKYPQPSLVTQPNTSLKNKTGAWRTHRPVTDYKMCISCALCAKICPEGCIKMTKQTKFANLKPLTNYDYCKGCGLCVKECPAKAIKMIADF